MEFALFSTGLHVADSSIIEDMNDKVIACVWACKYKYKTLTVHPKYDQVENN